MKNTSIKSTLIAIIASGSLAAGVMAETFSANPYTAGDTTVTWSVLGSTGGSGTLTAVTTINGGFRELFDSTTLSSHPQFNGTAVPTAFTNGTAFIVFERPGTVSFSYSGDSIIGDITGMFGSLASGNVLTLSGNPMLTANDILAYDATTSATLAVGTSLGGINITDNNSNGIATFNNWSLGTFSFTGVSPTSSISTAGGVYFNVIPEPSSALLLGLGGLGLLVRRKRS